MSTETWQEILAQEKEKPYYARLREWTEQAYATETVYPPRQAIFRALALTPLTSVRVVILGQDPYHGRGQAQGLSFSVSHSATIPPSLRNIFKELAMETGMDRPLHGSLISWALQGVLLLNTVLTVSEGAAGSHRERGWEILTDELIRHLSAREEPIIFLLWGRDAQRKRPLIDEKRHTVLCAAHPSPFAAHRGFFGCRHFKQVNEQLAARGERPINWSPYRAVVFDMDGTLTDSAPAICADLNKAIETVTDFRYTAKEILPFLGDGAQMLIARTLDDLRKRNVLQQESSAVRDEVFPSYQKITATGSSDDRIQVYDGMRDVLRRLREAGFLLGIYSNKNHEPTERIAEKLFPDLFDFVLGQKANQARKPDTNALVHVLKEFGVYIRDVIYVGDSVTDIQTGRAGKMKTVAVTWGYETPEVLDALKPDRLIERPEELLTEIGM